MAIAVDRSQSPIKPTTASTIVNVYQEPELSPLSSRLEEVPSHKEDHHDHHHHHHQQHHQYSVELKYHQSHPSAASNHLQRLSSTSPPPRRLSLQYARPPYEHLQCPPRAASRPTSGVYTYSIPASDRPYHPQFHHGPHRSPMSHGFSSPSSQSSLRSSVAPYPHPHPLSTYLESIPHQLYGDQYLDDRHDVDSVKSPAIASSISSGKPTHSIAHPPNAYITRSTYSESDLEDHSRSSSPQSATGKRAAGAEHHTLRTWAHLCFTAPLLTIFGTFYALVSVFLVLLTLPFHVCSRSEETISQQWSRLMLSPINLQRRLICFPVLVKKSDVLPTATTPQSEATVETNLGAGTMLLINLCSPVVSVGLAVACWVVGTFWVMSTLVTDNRTHTAESTSQFSLDEKAPSDDGHNMAKSLAIWWGDRWLAGGMFGATLLRRRSQTSVDAMRERRRS